MFILIKLLPFDSLSICIAKVVCYRIGDGVGAQFLGIHRPFGVQFHRLALFHKVGAAIAGGSAEIGIFLPKFQGNLLLTVQSNLNMKFIGKK